MSSIMKMLIFASISSIMLFFCMVPIMREINGKFYVEIAHKDGSNLYISLLFLIGLAFVLGGLVGALIDSIND